MAKHNDTGKLGERLALEWIIEKGYKIIEKIGDADIGN